MPIKINGTTVTTNRINGTSISKETLNGTQVYGGSAPKTKVWGAIYDASSPPSVDLGSIQSSNTPSNWSSELSSYWNPNNYPLGTTACVWDGSTLYRVFQVQEV